jgi:hypothetical protein
MSIDAPVELPSPQPFDEQGDVSQPVEAEAGVE